MNVIKKDGTLEAYDEQKIIDACSKAANRAMYELTTEDYQKICDEVWVVLTENDLEDTDIYDMHNIVESVLEEHYPIVGKMYKEYRNYKKDFVHMMDRVYERSQSIRYIGDKSNANTDSALVATKRSLIYNELSGELYQKFFLTKAEKQAMKDGYIYIHDKSARLDTFNCDLMRVGRIMRGGFEMGNVWYNEPKSIDTAFDVMGDIILSTASQQYGGFTVPEVDKILSYYAEKSYKSYLDEFMSIVNFDETKTEEAERWAKDKVMRDIEQGWQGIEMKLNTVGSSRGDYPFVTMTIGLDTSEFGKMISIGLLKVHSKGQGKNGFKKPVLFPKIVFLFDKNIHCKGGVSEDVFEAGLDCSSKTMYPDWLSLTGNGYIADMYKKYGKVVSPMGCRAFLSPWYERGGMHPFDENDVPVFEGRCNMGVVSLNLPMILAKSRQESKDFYEVLLYYLELIRNHHKRTIDYLGELRASVNPIAFCEGGLYGGNLKPDDKIKSILKPMTISYGVTALNELQQLYNGKSIREDGEFALEVMRYMQDYIDRIKEEDQILYAIYGTPAESLCFCGDTVVQTLDGDKCIKDITTDDFVYSYNEDAKKIELKPVLNSVCTSTNAKVVRVNFTNGQSVVCTPNHPFAVRTMVKDEGNGKFLKEVIQYVDASELKHGDRIKSNYITISSDGHYRCSTKQKIHDINAECFLGEKLEGYVVHHKNENKLDNSIKNLEYMLDSEHRKLHYHLEDYQFTSENASGKNNKFYGKKHSESAIETNRRKHLGKNNVMSKEVVQLSLDGKIVNVYESRGMAEKETSMKNISYACNGKYSTKGNPHEYKGYLWYYANDIEGYSAENHEVESVEWLEETIPVYDITVADNHNFYVGGKDGILVHNCGLQVEQFRKIYGIVENVSDKPYVSNSFHCHVSENMSPIEKQDKEERFWNYFNGGKIQYVRYNLGYNKEAIRTLVLRAMEKGFYEGVNLALCYCEDCGYQQVDMDVCPQCGSSKLTKIDRMNGYLGFTRVHGDTRYNTAKNEEIKDRVSM